MNYKAVILSEAELDIEEAFIWYELNQIRLGKKFYLSINKSIHFISAGPFGCAVIYKGLRRFIINKFPYGIYYNVDPEKKEVQIIGVIHFKRNSKIIRKRT